MYQIHFCNNKKYIFIFLEEEAQGGACFPRWAKHSCVGKWSAGDDREADQGNWFQRSEGVLTCLSAQGQTLQLGGCVIRKRQSKSEMLSVRRYSSGNSPWRSKCSYSNQGSLESRGPRTWCSPEKGVKSGLHIITGTPGKPLLAEVFLPENTSSFHSQWNVIYKMPPCQEGWKDRDKNSNQGVNDYLQDPSQRLDG